MTKEIEFLVGNKPVKLQHFLGHVFDTNVWSETHVYGGGGGAHGNVQINSVVVNKKEIWVRNDLNVDAHFSISAPVAPGQKVSVFSFINPRSGHTISVGYCNYASGSGFNYYPESFKNTLAAPNMLLGIFIASLLTLGAALLVYVPLYLSENKKNKLMLEKLIEFGNKEVQLELERVRY
jgi:hypothetical protein